LIMEKRIGASAVGSSDIISLTGVAFRNDVHCLSLMGMHIMDYMVIIMLFLFDNLAPISI